MTEFEQALIKELQYLNTTTRNIYEILNIMVVEGLVVLPDTVIGDN